VRTGSGEFALENVCALWPGNDPKLAHEVVIVSAHYDHVGLEGGKVHPGADDNGSGSMGLLALAEALVEYGPLRRSVLLLWVSGEEKGLWGSAAWTKAPTLSEGQRAICNLNIDMIGRNAPDYLLITPTRKLPHFNGLTRLAEELAPLEGFPRLGSADDYWERSDHRNFAVNLGIPVAFLFSDVHADYHRPTDTVEKIDNDKVRRVARLVLRMLDALQEDELKL
jgi:Zn-dependent M28 family amino/carboxypeptidase